jgi:hypothetical protein
MVHIDRMGKFLPFSFFIKNHHERLINFYVMCETKMAFRGVVEHTQTCSFSRRRQDGTVPNHSEPRRVV